MKFSSFVLAVSLLLSGSAIASTPEKYWYFISEKDIQSMRPLEENSTYSYSQIIVCAQSPVTVIAGTGYTRKNLVGPFSSFESAIRARNIEVEQIETNNKKARLITSGCTE